MQSNRMNRVFPVSFSLLSDYWCPRSWNGHRLPSKRYAATCTHYRSDHRYQNGPGVSFRGQSGLPS